MSLAIAERARTGCLGLFVFGFAMNDGGGRFAPVFADTLPDAHHVTASGIDNPTATLLGLLTDPQFPSVRALNDHFVCSESGTVGLCFLPTDVLDPSPPDFVIHLP